MIINRKKHYQLIAIAKTQLAIDEDTHRDILKSHGASLKQGRYSATTLSDQQLVRVLDYYEHLGFRVTRRDNDNSKRWPINTRVQGWRGPMIKKIVAQWNDLANQNKVRSRSLESCRRYCQKQTGVERLEWMHATHLNRVIEGLKAWQKRQIH